MPITEDLERNLAEFPALTPNPEELARLQEFLLRMKNAGIAKTQEYNIPRPDTIGRTLANFQRKAT
jgi:hypothetical protein